MLNHPSSELLLLYGDCLLRMQRCERLLKAILASSEISISTPEETKNLISNRLNKIKLKTFGQVINEELKEYLLENPIPSKINSQSINIKHHLEYDSITLKNIRIDLEYFINARNILVHHFFDRYDLLNSSETINAEQHEKAKEYLKECIKNANHHYHLFMEWKINISNNYQHITNFINSSEFDKYIKSSTNETPEIN